MMNFTSSPSNITTNEVKIGGIIREENLLDPLKTRLAGILGTKHKDFKEWINVYRTKSSLLPTPSSTTTTSDEASVSASLQKSKDVELHVQCDITPSGKLVWRDIKSLGKSLPRKDAKVSVRTITFSSVFAGNPLVMLELMGCE